ncbi:uncharacterized protein LOC130711716 isoform X2 [Lotus japonicus]|uniref:uncharacterized protein LOC130711716 isoform X2 n=1 Tax=Lotus japonicus TaxID=34305 RepID=UPI00259031ED|nr:uncharacterized protein LOC130711716 isoform X2 [Lotus japonicus]
MDHQWRPNPRPIQFQPNVCPTCSISHFPFCPPPPFTSHPCWPPHHPNYHLADADRNFKRPRIIDEPFSEDERRLKLIRDHGLNPPQPPHHHGYVTPPLPHHHHQQQQPNQNGFHSDSHLHYPLRGIHHPHQQGPYYHEHAQPHDFRPSINESLHAHEANFPPNQKLNGHYHYPYPPGSSGSFSENMGQMEGSRFFRGQPPLPSSPPPPLPMDPPMKAYFSPPKQPPSLFPVHEPSKQYLGDAQSFLRNQLTAEKPKFVDASHLFRHPHRASRPDHFVIILRGLPGSGKSYLAKMLRDLEIENGGDAPRIHSMDDYFMTEVEDNDASKSSSSGRNKKAVKKKVMEYCYEPEMEEAYRSSMLKAFKKTVEEGDFTFVIVDDRNLRVADFAQFWATAKRSGYEVYILEATYKDPAGCAARNVHGFTQEDIEKMAGQWEDAPSLYMQLDMKSLFHGDDLKQSKILEVDMDMEDDLGEALPAVQGREAETVVNPPVRDDAGPVKDGKRWSAEEEHVMEVRELGKSKWSEDFAEDDIVHTEGMKGNINALSGLIHQYGKEQKSVHWGDQAGNTGFSIGSARKVNALSLVIGPGAGYNLNTNPLPQEDSSTRNSAEPKKNNTFQDRIRAERESFKAVFDRRRHRIGGLNVEDD